MDLCTSANIANTSGYAALNVTNACEFVQAFCKDQSDLVNFIDFFYCDINSNYIAISIISVIFVAFSFNFFGTMADIYLGPTLEILSDKLKLSAAVAGCTLLAFANGAPDVISGIVAGGKSSDGLDIAIGGLFGACLFTCTIVLSRCIQGGGDITVQSDSMIRDVGFLLIGVIYFVFLTLIGDIPWWLTTGFFGVYVAYIIYVILSERHKEAVKQRVSSMKAKLRQKFLPKTNASSDSIKRVSFTVMASNYLLKQNIKKALRKGKSVKLEDFGAFKTTSTKFHEELEEEDDNTTSGKIMQIYTRCLTFVTDLTMPAFEKEHWNYFKTIVTPCLGTAFVAFQLGLLQVDKWEFWVVYCLITLPPTIMIGFAGRARNLAEQWDGPFSAATFLISSLWINLIATIFMDWLSMVSLISGLPINFLSLTLLAWGNSLGDFFVNYVISKNGQGVMAVTGTYSGQIFNLLCGFGGAIFRQTFNAYNSHSAPINLTNLYDWSSDGANRSTDILTVGLIFTTFTGLIFSLIVAASKKWTLNRAMLIFLVTLYFLFLSFAVGISFFQIKKRYQKIPNNLRRI